VPLDESMPAFDGDPENVFERKLAVEELSVAARKLTSAQQEVIALRFTSELSVAEVARIMGRSEGAVKALQHSAIATLRKVLAGGAIS
jgi:RNA polymerase sigma-70 factor (ECF subfamily)